MKIFTDDHDWIIGNTLEEAKNTYGLVYGEEIENEPEWYELDENSEIRVSLEEYDFVSDFNDKKLPENYSLDIVNGRFVIISTVGEWLKIKKEPEFFMSLDY